LLVFFFFSSRRRHTRSYGDWSSDVCSSDLRDVQVACHAAAAWHATCTSRCRALVVVDHDFPWRKIPMTWTKPEFEVVELGMEVRSEERRVGKECRYRWGR